MLNWFEKEAPIRTKFKVLLVAQSGLSGAGLATTWLAGGDNLLVGCAAAAAVAAFAVVWIASQRICTPYVNTVLRMEALAQGDTTSQIAYTDYNDCVGRMTKAMSTFRNNAVEVQTSRAAQDTIVGELTNGLGRLADNELDFELNKPFPGDYDELRKDFNTALNSVASAISAVRSGSGRVLNGAKEIRAASDDLSVRNEQQAASLEETAAAMNQATDSVKQTAARATEVQQTISGTHREAVEGGKVVLQANAAMASIEKSANEITQIIDVIDGIAFQTNLLALNAGVEAARAGDAGKGFAVVANEVRALAQRSAEAASNIKELIIASSAQVSGGVTLVNETGTLLEKIVGQVGEINNLISDIASAANNQASSLQQVNSAVAEMDRMTQQNAAMVEQSTAAARSLADEASELTALVSQFRTNDRAAGANPVSRKASDHHGTTLAFPAADMRRGKPAPRPMPAVDGNLALAPSHDHDEDNWSEF